MHVISVHLGLIREATWKGKGLQNCNIQGAISGPVPVATLGLGGDNRPLRGNATNDGGVLMALFAYPFEDYTEFWQLVLATTPPAHGSFGENLTTQGWMDDQIHVGDTYRVVTALMARPSKTLRNSIRSPAGSKLPGSLGSRRKPQ